MMQKRHYILLLTGLILLGTVGCSGGAGADRIMADTPEPQPTLDTYIEADIETEVADADVDEPETEIVEPEPAATIAPTVAPLTPIEVLVFPEPRDPFPLLAQENVTDAERETDQLLSTELPTARNDLDLAISYLGLDPSTELSPIDNGELTVGTIAEFTIHNVDNNTDVLVTAELKAIGEHAYFWFDQTPGNPNPTDDMLQRATESFDLTYQLLTEAFGSDKPEGAFDIDGDPRIHVFNASPQTICNPGGCGLLGYYSGRDALPIAVNPVSNQKDMFVMNGSQFGNGRYFTVLGHEFRHMIEFAYDQNDWDWEVEGSAMLAEDLLGSAGDGIGRANQFLNQPDQQLNRWSESSTIAHYGQGYLMNRYIYNRLGPDLYREFAQHPAPGFDAVTAVAAANGLDFTGLELWIDWLVAHVVHQQSGVDEKYGLPVGIQSPRTINLSIGMTESGTVAQYAADYFTIGDGSSEFTLKFTGSTHTPLMQTQPASGQRMWVANRTNQSQAQLTRAFDLTQVDTATLHYSVYRDIEIGYDFAYVSVSTDGGVTWQGLSGAGMDGVDPADDPSNDAFTERYYTGRNFDGSWIDEVIDLSLYAGQMVHVRFEYVTDPILTYEGIAIDNIAIPEIGFIDDVETGNTGWDVNGFVPATGYLPQIWQVQILTFADGKFQVSRLEFDSFNRGELVVPATGSAAVVIVSASSPMTLQPAHYQLVLE